MSRNGGFWQAGRVVVCPGKVWFGWLGGLWHGRLLYGLFRFGRRVMVRLGAVLCGTVMYGLVWLARLGGARFVAAV